MSVLFILILAAHIELFYKACDILFKEMQKIITTEKLSIK